MKNQDRGVKRKREEAFEPEKFGLSNNLFGEDTNVFHEVVQFFDPQMCLQCYQVFNKCEAFLDVFDFVLQNPYEIGWGCLCGIAKNRFWSLKEPYTYEAYFEDFSTNGWTTLDGKEVKVWTYDSDDGPLSVAFHMPKEKQMIALICMFGYWAEESWHCSFLVRDVIGVQYAGGHSVYHESFLYATSNQIVFVHPRTKKRYVLLDLDEHPMESKTGKLIEDPIIIDFDAGEAYGNHSWFFEVSIGQKSSSDSTKLRFQLDISANGVAEDERMLISFEDKQSIPINAIPLEENDGTD